MPSKKKKYNARFPPGRIKKIMQTDEEVGKVAQAVPIIISKTLELFVHSLLTKTNQITSSKQLKTLSPAHMKQCILAESKFDFLRDLVKNIPDAQNTTAEGSQSLPPTLVPSTLTMNPIPREYFNSKFLPHHTSTIAKDNSSKAQIPSFKQTPIKEEITQSATPVNINTTLFSEDVSKLKTSILPNFNASKPNFYMELNSNASDNNSVQKTDSVSHTAEPEEDYET